MIPAAVDYVEAITALRPVAFHKPRSTAAKTTQAGRRGTARPRGDSRRRASRKGSRVMGKLDELLKHQGNMDASLGVGYARGITPPGMSLDHAQRLPSRLHGVSKSKSTVEILVDKIQADPDQPREEFDADALARARALAEDPGPTSADPRPLGRGVVVVHHHHGRASLARAVQAKLETLTCVVHEGTPDPASLLRCSSSRTPSAKTSGRSSRRRRISADGGERLERQPSRAGTRDRSIQRLAPRCRC